MKVAPNTYRKKLKRYNIPNHARELTFSCYHKYPYFNDPIACMIFMDFLRNARSAYDFELWAWVIMPNHIHLLVWPKEEAHLISQILHSVKGNTGKHYRRHLLQYSPEMFDNLCVEFKTEKKLKLWQPGGGYDRNMWNAKAVHQAIQYIENNPVRAGFVKRPEQWEWSSAWARENQSGLIPDQNIPMWLK